MAEGKLTYQHANAEEKSEPAKKRRREAARVEHTRTVAEHFKPADVSSVKEVWPQFVAVLYAFLVNWYLYWLIVVMVWGHKDDVTQYLR